MGCSAVFCPLTGSYDKGQTLSEFLKEISTLQRSNYRHQSYLIGDLGKDLKMNASDGYVCEVLINYEPLDFELSFGEEIEANIARIANEGERNPLQLCWRDYGKQQPLQLQIQFSSEYFNQREIELLAQRVISIIAQFPDALDKSIEYVNILPAEEAQLLFGFNGKKVSYPQEKTVVDLFEEHALQTPETIAIVYEEQHLSYRALNERSNQLAHYLRGKGVKEETLVPLLIERGIDMLVGILGILKAGAAYVPIDTDFPEDRISYMLENTGARVVVSSSWSSHKVPVDALVDVIEIDEERATLRQQPAGRPVTELTSDNLAYVIYTSGSTGKPKGVQISHRNLVDYVYGLDNEINISECRSFGLVSTIATDLGNTVLYGSLLTGGTLHLFSKEIVSHIEDLHDYFDQHEIDCLKIVLFALESIDNGWKTIIAP